jgi:tRNA-2-methylthio-N6-dimethylallyladenosine synthase
LQRLQSLQAEHTIVSLENRVGKPDQVLVEGMSRKPQDAATPSWRGRDLGGRIVNFNYDTRDLVGKIVPVTITEAKKHSLWGEVSGSPW